MTKKVVRYKRINGALVRQFESPALVDGLVDIGQLPVVGNMGAAVIERGSNTNGSYIKWADGTMVCWQGTFSHPVTFQSWASDTTNRQYIYNTSGIVYPASFISAPSICISGGGNNLTYGFVTAQVPEKSQTDAVFLTFVPDLPTSSLSFVAIGRWK